ncbi:hypothetical protein [Ferruginibacter sp.]
MKLIFKLLLLLCVQIFAVKYIAAQKPGIKKPVAKKIAVQKIEAPENNSSVAVLKEQTFKNGITLTTKGFVIQDAYLVFNDRTKVGDSNKVDLNQQVNLTLLITEGFKEVRGKIFPGGSEQILWSNGEKLVESGDVFKLYDSSGVSKVNANAIVLKAVITELNDKRDWVTISFKVWDKRNAASEINGSYKLYIK